MNDVLHKGQRVRHPTMPEWGLGEVLEDVRGNTTRVFFVGAGEMNLSNSYVQLLPVEKDQGAHPVLDNLHLATSPGIKYRSLPESVQYFLKEYPGGFSSERFLADERNYKVAAHELATSTLNEKELRDLLGAARHGEICTRAQKLVQETNLIFPNEKMALRDGLKSSEGQIAFSQALTDALYGSAPEGERFSSLATALSRIGAGKWTTTTYFFFLTFPQRHMFVKPTVTQNAAAVSGFNIDYRPEVNWGTYARILAFSEYLKSELAPLKPRDMIDVQSFMWCIAPHI